MKDREAMLLLWILQRLHEWWVKRRERKREERDIKAALAMPGHGITREGLRAWKRRRRILTDSERESLIAKGEMRRAPKHPRPSERPPADKPSEDKTK